MSVVGVRRGVRREGPTANSARANVMDEIEVEYFSGAASKTHTAWRTSFRSLTGSTPRWGSPPIPRWAQGRSPMRPGCCCTRSTSRYVRIASPAAKSQFKRGMNSHPIQRPPIRRSPHTLNPHLTRSPPVRATPRSPSGTRSNAPSGTRGTHSVPWANWTRCVCTSAASKMRIRTGTTW